MGRCERCGGKFDYEGYCEICGSDDEWTWNPPKYNKNKIICKKCGNEIYEVRRHCRYCGTKNEAAFKEGEYYCPCCGIAIEDGHCPNCGKELEDLLAREIKPIDLRYCTSCGKEISRNDEICLFCGRENYQISERIIWSGEAMRCPDCRKEIWVKDKFCPYCGRKNTPKKPEPSEQIKIDSSDGRIIPKKIPVEDYRCPGCGRYFDFDGFCWNCAIERFKVSTRRLRPEEATDCPYCKEKISVKDKFCTYCGREINPKKPEPHKQTENDKPVIHAKIPDRMEYKPIEKNYSSEVNTTLWLILGIVSLIICCTPTSIGTIICSLSAKGAENIGDNYTAVRKIRAAKIWFFAGAAAIVLLMIASVIIQFITNIE